MSDKSLRIFSSDTSQTPSQDISMNVKTYFHRWAGNAAFYSLWIRWKQNSHHSFLHKGNNDEIKDWQYSANDKRWQPLGWMIFPKLEWRTVSTCSQQTNKILMCICTSAARAHNAEGQTDSIRVEVKCGQHSSFYPTMPHQLLLSSQGCAPVLAFQGSWSYPGSEMTSSILPMNG